MKSQRWDNEIAICMAVAVLASDAAYEIEELVQKTCGIGHFGQANKVPCLNKKI